MLQINRSTFGSSGLSPLRGVKALAIRSFGSDVSKKQAPSSDDPEFPWGPFKSESEKYNYNRQWNLKPDGTNEFAYRQRSAKWEDDNTFPPMKYVKYNGKVMVWGDETKPFEELFQIAHKNIPMKQTNIPFIPRRRIPVFANRQVSRALEFSVFHIPTFLCALVAIPTITMAYLQDELIYTTMTVKVTGRQWYWLYEVESPTEEIEE
eukprot:GHVN01074237.1.p1 GENE.GHVN01074237.1~~GHVN01074237.1.p1  ORF type:complete len:207 (-),score=17.62 GHVN01074237.1:570-1190(-)